MNIKYPTQDFLKENYDYRDGKLVHIKPKRGRTVGQPIGFLDKRYGKYHLAVIDERLYFLHRLIWIWHNGSFGEFVINHRDGNTQDNRIENLRAVTQQESCFTRGGVKGCAYHKQTGKWEAYIKVNQKKIHLGLHPTEEDAGRAYIAAKVKYHKIDDKRI